MSRAYLLLLAEEKLKRTALRIERRRLRDTSDPLQLPEMEFIAQYRINQIVFQQVFHDISPYLNVSQRRNAIPKELKVLAVLNFYANGSYQRNVGASFLCNMSQPSFSRCLKEVTKALNTTAILKKYIKFPSSRDEREIIMRKFVEKFGFPGVIGCIDGTHVSLIRPKEHEEAFFNRKNYHSLNVLVICDSDLKLLHVDASFGGASHDSHVWNQSQIKSILENLDRNGEHCWLLGGSGYAQHPWMLTPILGAGLGTPEAFYTDLHCRVRNTVERCIGLLKARWRCLLAHRVLHYDPITVAKIVNACAVLHNIALANNVPLPDLPVDSDLGYQILEVQPAQQMVETTRDRIISRLWTSRSRR